MRIFQMLILTLMLLVTVPLCRASGIIYNLNLTIGANGSVTGEIVTDGTIGVLAEADITGYSLLLSDPGVDVNASTFTLNCCNFFPFSGSDLSATADQLLFNFSGTDNGVVDFADASLDFDVCFSTPGGVFGPASFCEVGGETLTFLNVPPGSIFPTGLHFDSTPLSGVGVIATAESASAPEPSTLVLLVAGIALLGFSLQYGRSSKSC